MKHFILSVAALALLVTGAVTLADARAGPSLTAPAVALDAYADTVAIPEADIVAVGCRDDSTSVEGHRDGRTSTASAPVGASNPSARQEVASYSDGIA